MGVPTLAVLAASAGDSIRDVAMQHQVSYAQAYGAVQALSSEGLVRIQREGKRALLSPGSPAIGALAAALLRKDHPAWPHVFHGDRVLLLHALHRLHDIPLAALVTGYARSSAYQAVRQLAEKGILLHKRGQYQVHRQHADLADFVEEWTRLRAQHLARELHPEARVLHHVGPEVLFRAPGELEGAQPAGLAAFGLHGIDIRPADPRPHALAVRSLGAGDHLCQALKASPVDPITRSYAALLWERIRPELEGPARIYGVTSEAHAVRRYVEERQDQDGFLPWREHERYRGMYLP